MSSISFYLQQHMNKNLSPIQVHPINYHQYGNNSNNLNIRLPNNNYPLVTNNINKANNNYILNDPRRFQQNEYRVYLDQQIQQTRERKQTEKTDYDVNRSNSLILNSVPGNDPISYKEIQKKRQSEYQLILKQQIEEKDKRKAQEKQKRLDDDKKFEEEYQKYHQLKKLQDKDQKTPYHLRPSSNKIGITGNNIINSSSSRKSISNGLEKQKTIDSNINNNQLGTNIKIETPRDNELNKYIDHKFNEMQIKAFNQPEQPQFQPITQHQLQFQNHPQPQPVSNLQDQFQAQIQPQPNKPSFHRNTQASNRMDNNSNTQLSFNSKQMDNLKIDNCVNEIISSTKLDIAKIPSYENKIDFSALDYRSKYEDYSNRNKETVFNDTNEFNNFDMSLKGVSKLVNTDYEKGLSSNYLLTWKKNDLTNPLKNPNVITQTQDQFQSSLIKNVGEYILGSSQSNFYKKDINMLGQSNQNNNNGTDNNNDIFQYTNKTNECIQSIKRFTDDLLKSENDNIHFCNDVTFKNNQFNLKDSYSNNIIRPPIENGYSSNSYKDDDLCNVRYPEDDDYNYNSNDNELELEKKLQGDKEFSQNNNQNLDDKFGKIDFNDDEDMSVSKDKESISNHVIEENTGQSETAKFPSQLDFFDQDIYESYSFQKSQQQKVEIYDNHSINHSNSLINTIEEIPSSLQSQQYGTQSGERINEPIDISKIDSQNEMYDRLLDDIDKYRQMAGPDHSPEIILRRSKKNLLEVSSQSYI